MEVVWNSSAADDFFERIVEPFERMTILFEQITRAVRTDDNFFHSDRLSRSNGYQRVGNGPVSHKAVSYTGFDIVLCNGDAYKSIFVSPGNTRLSGLIYRFSQG